MPDTKMQADNDAMHSLADRLAAAAAVIRNVQIRSPMSRKVFRGIDDRDRGHGL
ncbi:hypothetical protein [Nocardia sp. NPDC050175]|uniref:hypothetical protein n=1 Tax=Nocardia sp. NPDC050175 TaxID=3364317 RepID=UPI00379DB60F